MKVLWVLVLIALPVLGFSQAPNWEKRTYEQALKDPRKTVVDYFLLCPGISMHDDGRFTFLPLSGVDPAFFPTFFEAKKGLLRRGYTARELSVDSVVIDVPNGYLSISGTSFSRPFTLTFVYFDRQGRGDIPAYSYIERGAGRNDHSYGFYELDGDNGWTDLEDSLLPRLRLSDLDADPKKPQDQYPSVDWEYILPQKGTTVLALPVMTREMAESGFKGSQYQLFLALGKRSIELLWDRKQGLFTKGAVR